MTKGKARVAVCGAGVIGRLAAARLVARGYSITLFDDRERGDRGAVSYAAAGMLTPFAERIAAEPEIATLGLQSLELWPKLLAEHGIEAQFRRLGSLVAVRPGDEPLLEQFRHKMRVICPEARLEDWSRERLAADEARGLEETLSAIVHCPAEGQIDNRKLMDELERHLEDKVTWRRGVKAQVEAGGRVVTPDGPEGFDAVIDARGLGARDVFSDLRPVRGELVIVQTDGFDLKRPLRVLHDRVPIYVVPRGEGRHLIGATEIESDDPGPARVQSILELLSGAYALHGAFRQARILELVSGLRPAFFDNRPRLVLEDRVLRVNGLFRHGFLLAPRVAEAAADWVEGRGFDPDLAKIVQDSSKGRS